FTVPPAILSIEGCVLVSFCFGQDAERVACLEGCILFSLLLAVAEAGTHGFTIDGYLCGKFLVVLCFLNGNDFEAYFFTLPLCPLYDLALVIGVRLDECVEVVVGVDQFIDDELLAAQVSFIEIDSAYNRFQRVAEDNLLKVGVLLVVLNDVGNTDFSREHVERFPVYKA